MTTTFDMVNCNRLTKITFAIIFLLFTGSVCRAQVQGQVVETSNFEANAINNDGSVFPNDLTGSRSRGSVANAEGDPFYKKAYSKATIFVNNQPSTEAFMRYNAHLDFLEVKQGTHKYELLKRDHIHAEIGGRVFRYMNYQEGDHQKKGYLIQLADGKTSFYLKPGKILKAAKIAKTGYDENVPARYIDAHSYYLKRGKGPVVKVRPNKRLLKQLFGDRYENVMDYAEQNNLDRKDPYELGKLIKWYNEQF